MKRFKMIVAYDGTNYHGFAKQNEAVTVQGTLEQAIQKITQEEIVSLGAGRTDAGVHAKGQCVTFDSLTKIPAERLLKAINSQLPSDIVVQSVEEVDENFHPRFGAKRKTYRYQIWCGKLPDPFTYRYALHYPYPVNETLMQEAAYHMVGEHDFACFCASGSQVKDTVRKIYSIDIKREGDMISIDICGNGFLYNMVRIIVGTLLYVNEGKLSTAEISEIIRGKDRKKAGPTVPPQGLTMLSIVYE